MKRSDFTKIERLIAEYKELESFEVMERQEIRNIGIPPGETRKVLIKNRDTSEEKIILELNGHSEVLRHILMAGISARKLEVAKQIQGNLSKFFTIENT